MLLTPEALSLHRILTMEKGHFPEVAEAFQTQGPQRVQAALATYLADQVKKEKLRKMITDIAARQFFDLVIPEFLFGMNLRSTPAPTRAEMRQRVKGKGSDGLFP